jgi:Family of unknown function (DUF5808)
MAALSLAILQASGPNPLPSKLLWIILAPLIFIAVMSLIPLLARSQKPSDPNSWKAGIFYVNRNDPALFVPKRIGIGYTINFGNPWAWFVLGILVFVILAPFVFTALTLTMIRHTLSSH